MIDVIIPSYNDIRIIRAISSITLRNDATIVRIIVIDGGSDECVLLAIKKLLRNYDLLISERDQGVFDALNKGLDLATNDIVGWIGADDFYSSKISFQEIETSILSKEIDAIIFDTAYFDSSGVRRIFSSPRSCWFYKYGGAIPHYSSFWSRRAIGDNRFNIIYKYASDLDFFYNLIVRQKCKFLSESIVGTYMELGGITTKNFSRVIVQNIQVFTIYSRYQGYVLAFLAVALKLSTKSVGRFLYGRTNIVGELSGIIIKGIGRNER